VRNRPEPAEASLAERIDDALHGLCQPLTVLQCRLAMGELVGGRDTLRQAIADALAECTRMNLAVGLMREMLQRELQTDQEELERTR
jgi:hypothetical protein